MMFDYKHGYRKRIRKLPVPILLWLLSRKFGRMDCSLSLQHNGYEMDG